MLQSLSAMLCYQKGSVFKRQSRQEVNSTTVICLQEGVPKDAATAGANTSTISSTSVSAAERDSLVPRIQSAKSFANLTERSSAL